MIEKNEILQFIREHHKYLEEHFHVTKVGLFGSFARGDQNSNSDIDLLIELEPDTPNIYELKNEIRQYFNNRFNRPVDLAREKYLKPYVRDEIMKETIYV